VVLTKVAVTGASGMLGQHLVYSLRLAGFDILCLSSKKHDSLEWRFWDLAEWKIDKELDHLLFSVDVVIHAGAIVPDGKNLYSEKDIFDVNVRATLNLAQWCRKRDLPLIYVSGAIVYKDHNIDNIKEDNDRGWSGFGEGYGLSKILAEEVLYREKSEGLDLAVIRPSSVYGYGISSKKLICSLLYKASEGGEIKIDNPVTDCFNFIHAADISSAVVEIINRRKWGTFNLASERCVTVFELAEACILVTKKGYLSISSKYVQRDPLKRFNLNIERASKNLEWYPQVNLSQGLSSIINKDIISVV